MKIEKYLNIPHDYNHVTCISLIGSFYENELGISWEEEKLALQKYNVKSLKDLFKVPIEDIYKLKNWEKVDLTNIQKYDIIIYTIKNKLSHFSMYVGNYKILTLHENERSQLRHFNDVVRNQITSIHRHRQLVT